MKGKTKKELENQVNELQKKIRELVLNPDGYEAKVIKYGIILEQQMENAIWADSIIKIKGRKLQGVISMLSNAKEGHTNS